MRPSARLAKISRLPMMACASLPSNVHAVTPPYSLEATFSGWPCCSAWLARDVQEDLMKFLQDLLILGVHDHHDRILRADGDGDAPAGKPAQRGPPVCLQGCFQELDDSEELVELGLRRQGPVEGRRRDRLGHLLADEQVQQRLRPRHLQSRSPHPAAPTERPGSAPRSGASPWRSRGWRLCHRWRRQCNQGKRQAQHQNKSHTHAAPPGLRQSSIAR